MQEKEGAFHRRVLWLAVLGLIAALVGGFFWATATPGNSYSGERATVQDAELAGRLEGHVRTLAASPRNLNEIASINRTTSYVLDELAAMSLQVERQEVIPPADNLIARIRARDADAPIVIIGAHYDTIAGTPGADDNATVIAALLEIARWLAPMDGELERELVLVFYANEEPPFFKTGAMGSSVHAQSLAGSERVAGMISLESMGYYSDAEGSQHYPFPLSLRYPDTGNFIAFVGDLSSRAFLRDTVGQFREHAQIASVGGTAPSIVQGIDWSDHWAYSQAGIPALMVTDTAPFRNPNYHRPTDLPDTLDYQRLALVVEGLQGMFAR